MPRTTSGLVIGILGRNYDSDPEDGLPPDLSPFMATATVIVDRVATCATAKGFTLSSTELELIERWLTAHFYCVNDPLYTSRSTQGASGSFQTGQVLEGFGATEYGRQAIAMDYSGCLKNISLKQRASMSWLGKPPSEQIPYRQRD